MVARLVAELQEWQMLSGNERAKAAVNWGE